MKTVTPKDLDRAASPKVVPFEKVKTDAKEMKANSKKQPRYLCRAIIITVIVLVLVGVAGAVVGVLVGGGGDKKEAKPAVKEEPPRPQIIIPEDAQEAPEETTNTLNQLQEQQEAQQQAEQAARAVPVEDVPQNL